MWSAGSHVGARFAVVVAASRAHESAWSASSSSVAMSSLLCESSYFIWKNEGLKARDALLCPQDQALRVDEVAGGQVAVRGSRRDTPILHGERSVARWGDSQGGASE